MLKKLRARFILLSMSALFAVIAVIIGSINLINYRSVVTDADKVLDILLKFNGSFPTDNGGVPMWLPPNMSRELPYESRYFHVTLDTGTGDVIQTGTMYIASIDPDTAVEYALTAMSGTASRGFADNYRYAKNVEDGMVQIIFLDWGRRLDAFDNFLFVSIGISIIGYLLVFIIISFFSSRIIRPISESYEKQKRFITDAGHEIKTPLTIINADADILEMEYGENEWLEDIQKQARRLTSLTNDLIYLARMEEAEQSMPMIEFPFSDVVGETASSFCALAATQNKQFQCTVQPMLSMRGNENAICQLVNILLDNALKYSPEGGKVSLTLERQNKFFRLSVYNTTENPISGEKLDLLFERFYRIDPSHNSQTGGYGIGLSVAKAIASAHNGRIQASTEDGHSLQVTVSFPTT